MRFSSTLVRSDTRERRLTRSPADRFRSYGRRHRPAGGTSGNRGRSTVRLHLPGETIAGLPGGLPHAYPARFRNPATPVPALPGRGSAAARPRMLGTAHRGSRSRSTGSRRGPGALRLQPVPPEADRSARRSRRRVRLPGPRRENPAPCPLRLHGHRGGRRGNPGGEPAGVPRGGHPRPAAGGRVGSRHVGGALRPALDLSHRDRPLRQSEGISPRRRGRRGPGGAHRGSPAAALHGDHLGGGGRERGPRRTGLVPALPHHLLRGHEAAGRARRGGRLPGAGPDGGSSGGEQPDHPGALGPPRPARVHHLPRAGLPELRLQEEHVRRHRGGGRQRAQPVRRAEPARRSPGTS